ncbi:AAA family ATPase [Spirillospora sp. CA-294931]|uniref:AAA family ATPase n=1 Tax=Spirillospora sp. CA-294931 TaxID=3240042 RepID=UPI003D8EADBC
MVWGPGYGSAPPPSAPVGEDPFAAAERDTRAMVAAGWWPSAPPQQRQHAISGRLLVLPDGTWWLFGAWARWYRLHPSDGQWYLCPPPMSPAIRMAARTPQGAAPPPLPPHVLPAGPDFSYDPPTPLPFVSNGFAPDLTSKVRATVDSASALPVAEYPHWWPEFTPSTPSTVVASWGVMLWCAAAPAFDSRLDRQMLDLWKPYRAKPLPGVDGPRWLTPPPLELLVGLYAERLRASRVDAAVVVLRTMWAVASALREDPRFQIRADALLSILSTTLSNPTVDYGALPYGDQAIAQQWLTRCPPNLVPALRNESSPGDNFRHAFYSLAEVVAGMAGSPIDPAYIEPRLVAAALLAADLGVIRKDVAGNIVPWLDPEIRYTVQAVLDQNGHPLRRLWPIDLELSEPLRSGAGERAPTLLAAMYELDLAWCRLAGGMPARPRGFPVPNAVIAGLIGADRVRATAKAKTVTPPPAPGINQQPSPFSAQGQPGLPPGAPPQPQGLPSPPDQPFVQPPAQPGGRDVPGFSPAQPPAQPVGQQAAFAAPDPQPAEEEKQEEKVAPPYTELGFQRPGMPAAGPMQPGQPAPFGMPEPPGQFQPPPPNPAAPNQQQPAAFAHPEPPAPPAPQQQPAAFAQPEPPTPHQQQPAAFAQPEPPTPQQQPAAFAQPAPPNPAAPHQQQPAAHQQQAGPQQPGGGAAPFVMPDAPGQMQPPPPNPAAAQPEPPQQYGRPDPQEEEQQSENVAPPYTELGFQRPGMAPPPAPVQQPGPAQQQPAASQQPPPPQQVNPYATRMEGPGAVQQQQPAQQQPAASHQPVPPAPPAGNPHTKVLGPGDLEDAVAEAALGRPAGPPKGDAGPGTRIMSETMVGDFDFLDDTPSPDTPVHQIPPPEDRTDRRILDRFGISFVSGEHDAGRLLDELRTRAQEWKAPAAGDVESTRVDQGPSIESTRVDGGTVAAPSILLVGNPHTGQRRLARLIALTLADAGLGDGSIRAHDAEDVRDAPVDRMAGILAQPGPAILFERLDVAVTGSLDPAAVATAVRKARKSPAASTALIATCEPRAYKRLLKDHPRLVETFRVHRLPDLSELDNRMTLLHVLSDERRVTVGASALEVARADLERLRGPGDLVNARLVETYLDQACQRHLERAGASRDRLVLTPDDFTGVAEGIEPALRPPGDVDGFLRQLDQLIGLDDVKHAVRELIDEAGLAADRARHGMRSKQGQHLAFVGPSGTGKTTVAGLIGGAYAALGLLDSGHVVACRPIHLAGRDQVDTETRVASMVDQALGGVLLIQEAHLLDRSPPVVNELLRAMRERRDRFMVVCSSPAAEMEGFLAGNPRFGAEFVRTLAFEGMGDRDLVGLFQKYAERDLYMLDEELRVELLHRFERLRDDPSFAFARTVRQLFEQTVARQAARLTGADVNAATVARLTARDLPDSPLEQFMGDFRERG